MPSFGPESTWARPRPFLRLLVPVLLAAFAFATLLTPAARAQEADPGAVVGDPVPAQPEAPAVVDPVTAPAADPGPPPEPAPAPEPPPPPPELSSPAGPAPTPPDEPRQPSSWDGSARDTVVHAPQPSFEPAPGNIGAATPHLTPPESSDSLTQTTAPLGWDVYDDALLAETLDGNDSAAGLGSAEPPSLGRLGGMSGIVSAAVERDRHQDAEPLSRATATPAGGSGPGGSGPGQGPSFSLIGGSGGSAAGIALLTLLGMVVGWLLTAPEQLRPFLSSTAMWRLSGYVPPIERPG